LDTFIGVKHLRQAQDIMMNYGGQDGLLKKSYKKKSTNT